MKTFMELVTHEVDLLGFMKDPDRKGTYTPQIIALQEQKVAILNATATRSSAMEKCLMDTINALPPFQGRSYLKEEIVAVIEGRKSQIVHGEFAKANTAQLTAQIAASGRANPVGMPMLAESGGKEAPTAYRPGRAGVYRCMATGTIYGVDQGHIFYNESPHGTGRWFERSNLTESALADRNVFEPLHTIPETPRQDGIKPCSVCNAPPGAPHSINCSALRGDEGMKDGQPVHDGMDKLVDVARKLHGWKNGEYAGPSSLIMFQQLFDELGTVLDQMDNK